MVERPERVHPLPARPALQQRVAHAILEAAAHELARRGEQVSMSDVAARAGVARATVYRYFPSRQALVESLVEATAADTAGRLESARIEEIPVDEGLHRAVRALFESGDAFVAVSRRRTGGADDPFSARVVRPLQRLVSRGQRSGVLRKDIPSAVVVESLLAQVAAIAQPPHSLGREDAVFIAVDAFLHGARARPQPV